MESGKTQLTRYLALFECATYFQYVRYTFTYRISRLVHVILISFSFFFFACGLCVISFPIDWPLCAPLYIAHRVFDFHSAVGCICDVRWSFVSCRSRGPFTHFCRSVIRARVYQNFLSCTPVAPPLFTVHKLKLLYKTTIIASLCLHENSRLQILSHWVCFLAHLTPNPIILIYE